MLIVDTVILLKIEKTACIIEFYLQVLCNRASFCGQLSMSWFVNWGYREGKQEPLAKSREIFGAGYVKQ